MAKELKVVEKSKKSRKFQYKLVFAYKRTKNYQLRLRSEEDQPIEDVPQNPVRMRKIGMFYSAFIDSFEKSGLNQQLQYRTFSNRHLRQLIMTRQTVTNDYAREVLNLR